MGGRYQGTCSLGHCNLTSPTSDSPPLLSSHLLLHLLQRRAGSCSVLWQANIPPPFQGLSSISQPVTATEAPAPYACIAPAAPASCWASFDLTHTRSTLSVCSAYCLPYCHCPAFACLSTCQLIHTTSSHLHLRPGLPSPSHLVAAAAILVFAPPLPPSPPSPSLPHCLLVTTITRTVTLETTTSTHHSANQREQPDCLLLLLLFS